jgi:hypothetical protein
MEYIMKKENILIDAKSVGLTFIEKMDFDNIDSVQDVLYCVFHHHKNDDDLDPRFLAIWNIFLSCVGWTEDEYFATLKERHENHVCDACKNEQEKSDTEKASN